jgi:hypothetical protein
MKKSRGLAGGHRAWNTMKPDPLILARAPVEDAAPHRSPVRTNSVRRGAPSEHDLFASPPSGGERTLKAEMSRVRLGGAVSSAAGSLAQLAAHAIVTADSPALRRATSGVDVVAASLFDRPMTVRRRIQRDTTLGAPARGRLLPRMPSRNSSSCSRKTRASCMELVWSVSEE